MKSLIILLFTSAFFNAQVTTESVCPNPKKIRSLCMLVGGKHLDTELNSDRYTYAFENQLFKAACVDITKDSEVEIARKIREVWNANEDMLICNSPSFNLSNGNIIKYAVNMQFENFILSVSHWGVNLNKVDDTDGDTVLDYVTKEIEKKQGSPLLKDLERYYQTLRMRGAKHRIELAMENAKY